MDIQRTILWVVFSMSLLLLWDNWMRYTGGTSMFFPNAVEETQPVAKKDQPADLPQAATTPGAPPAQGTAAPAAASEHITITTDVLKATIDSLGGQLERLELLQYRDDEDPTKNLLLFDRSAKRTYLGQSGLIGGNYPTHKTMFSVAPGSRTLDGQDQVQVVLQAEEGGIRLTKTYTFKRDTYLIDLKHQVSNVSGAPVSPSLYLQLVRDGGKLPGESMFYSTFTGPMMYNEAEKFTKVPFDDIAKNKTDHVTKTDNGWFGMVQHYFVSAFVPPQQTARENFSKQIATDLYAVGTVLPLGTIAPDTSLTMDTPLFSGPQESDRLKQVAPGFELVKDYGILTIIAKPIFWLMTQIHKVLNNWGWTIIALTVLIKLVFFPLSAASYRSMARMRLVSPKMTAIRERHKGDATKINQAMMELYKTEKINPLGGCLPIVVQIPVFISLYWVLLASVEMRNAPWLGWIHDLSAPDPFYILPIVMAASMFIQTKLNPTPPDPIQAKVMMFMPIIFSVMFFFFPAGLVLYWVVNNILSIAQQWVITRKMEKGKPA